MKEHRIRVTFSHRDFKIGGRVQELTDEEIEELRTLLVENIKLAKDGELVHFGINSPDGKHLIPANVLAEGILSIEYLDGYKS